MHRRASEVSCHLRADAHTQPSKSRKWSASQCTKERGRKRGRKSREERREERKVSKSKEGVGAGRSDRVQCCWAPAVKRRGASDRIQS